MMVSIIEMQGTLDPHLENPFGKGTLKFK